ncbi:hypothetical protein CKA32_001180 [Geitlerinema sp. FC II]|nr:hypothetical protein CKA32_001180 [Geitlerinema sp. FC II]
MAVLLPGITLVCRVFWAFIIVQYLFPIHREPNYQEKNKSKKHIYLIQTANKIAFCFCFLCQINNFKKQRLSKLHQYFDRALNKKKKLISS